MRLGLERAARELRPFVDDDAPSACLMWPLQPSELGVDSPDSSLPSKIPAGQPNFIYPLTHRGPSLCSCDVRTSGRSQRDS